MNVKNVFFEEEKGKIGKTVAMIEDL